MLSRSEVVNNYREIGERFAPWPAVSGILDELPPVLCQKLALEQRVAKEEVERMRSYSGASNQEFVWWRPADGRMVGLLDRYDLEHLAGELPLAGHRAATNGSSLNNRALRVLEELEASSPERSGLISDWTSLIVWVEMVPGETRTLLTSSTFPLLPHCTFLSRKALRHIPPNSVFVRDSTYALAENLYHEALHQELAATLLHSPILADEYWADTSVRVPVPWRGSSWEPDRVLHAVYVYAGLLPMRVETITSVQNQEERSWLESAISEGFEALRYLLNRLLVCDSLFSEHGKALRGHVVDRANSSLHLVSTYGEDSDH